jgi:hypothetical protein
VSGAGNYLLRVRVVLPGPEAVEWEDIDSIEVVGVAADWEVIPRTQCQMAQTAPTTMLGATVGKLCGATPTFENILNIRFSSESDAALPGAAAPTVTVRLNHRREGWYSFTYSIPAPPPITTNVDATAGAVTQPTSTTTTTVVTSPTIDVTKVRWP